MIEKIKYILLIGIILTVNERQELSRNSKRNSTQNDRRYGKGAYFFIREALDHTLKSLDKNSRKNKGHVSGMELLEGIRSFALDRFGPNDTNPYESLECSSM